MRDFFTFSQHHYTRESLAAKHRFQLSTVRAYAFCEFAIAFAGARGRAVVRRIALCFGFLAGVVGVFRWGLTSLRSIVWCFLAYGVSVWCMYSRTTTSQTPDRTAKLNHMSHEEGHGAALRVDTSRWLGWA
jgi:hypothetical protein